VLDLGCGDGGFTAGLASRWPQAVVEGIDSSPEMIARAQEHTTVHPALHFQVGDASTLEPSADYDVVLSNAMWQWVPGHADILRRWAGAMASGSWLAFQVPGNFAAASHVLMRELAARPDWAVRLPADVLRVHDTVLDPTGYAELFLSAGWRVDAWEATYVHLLPGENPVLDWVRGTGLRPVLNALSADHAAAFTAEYGQWLKAAYPAGPHGTFFPFRRVFCVAHK
jgi:trans-aconitate 2-methyltransferase